MTSAEGVTVIEGAANVAEGPRGGSGPFAPLRERTFRTIWTTSLLSNFGQLILGVGAAWEMTRLTSSPEMVALVQSALMLPMMIVAVPAGAIADMFDRRKVALAGLGFATLSAALLTILASAGFTTPALLLIFCALIGAGVALYGPAWQASVREQVSADRLPAAVALGSISYNLARSFGPALGGVIVLLFGAKAAFGVNAACYVPLFLAFLFWRRTPAPSRLPPERLDRAIVAGARYAIHAPAIRTVLIRSLTVSLASSSVMALGPIVARDLLHGNAGTYGVLLGVYGVGAVSSALLASTVRERFRPDVAVSACIVAAALAIIVIGFSRSMLLTAAAMGVTGAGMMLLVSLFNVGVQLSAPRWVTARALSWFQSSTTGGMAIGAWVWGSVAQDIGTGHTLVVSGIVMLAMPLLAFLLPMPRVTESDIEPFTIGNEPEVALAITQRSGPIVVEIDYRVDPGQARLFYAAMRDLQKARKRNGAFDWSIARDIADPTLWTERYQCPTWGDYLRLRDRATQKDVELQDATNAFLTTHEKVVRRKLERPFGSVRWRAETPDVQTGPIPIYTH